MAATNPQFTGSGTNNPLRLPGIQSLQLPPNAAPNTPPSTAPNPAPKSPPVRRTARKQPATRGLIRQPRKAGPQTYQGKRNREIFGAPLKIYNPRQDARLRAQTKARKKGATPEEVPAAGHRKLRRSHPGSTILFLIILAKLQ